MRDGFLEEWFEAARDLDLDIQAPFLLVLESGAHIKTRLLLKNFGAVNGMLIVTDWDTIAQFAEEIVEAGYGYSTLSESDDRDQYNHYGFVEMLRDWGWSGPEALQPDWCLPLDDDEHNGKAEDKV